MMRRIAVVLGLAWTFLLAWFVFGQAAAYFRRWACPSWEAVKELCQLVLLYGTMAFLCFAVAVIMGRGGESGPAPGPTDHQDES